jgi:hypothetical protein
MTEELAGVFQCLGIFPKHPTLLTYIAGFYRLEGELETALKYLLNAYEALPSPEIGIHLSDLYLELGNDVRQKFITLSSILNSMSCAPLQPRPNNLRLM